MGFYFLSDWESREDGSVAVEFEAESGYRKWEVFTSDEEAQAYCDEVLFTDEEFEAAEAARRHDLQMAEEEYMIETRNYFQKKADAEYQAAYGEYDRLPSHTGMGRRAEVRCLKIW